MRNLIRFTAVLLMVVATATVNAQTLKFGHIDLQALIQVMPERATAEAEFNTYQAEIEEVFGELNTNLTTLMQEFESMGAEVSEIKRDAKVTEITELQQRIRNYEVSAQQQLQQKQNDLMQPIYTKAQTAIEEIGKEQGLIYVFEVNSLLYSSNQSVDILPMVKQKLGIQ
ncbi:MAG: OmpH family outer membrane protein [Prolixibacteraceae bacterium]|nr:OmpH family outer membrane protein [Prolixibacteraceae bacterium]